MSQFRQPMEDEEVENRVLEWEEGLPSADDLTPLFQNMLPPQLAFAFSVTTKPVKTYQDVNLASQKTFFNLRRCQASSNSSSTTTATAAYNLLPSLLPSPFLPPSDIADRGCDVSYSESSKKARFTDSDEIPEDFESNTNSVVCGSGNQENSVDESTGAERGVVGSSSKRPRLVWTPQLHKRFVDVVAHLGLKNAVPKTIMRLMNVDGLTRENVASHLQKYRLYVNRIQDGSHRGDDFPFFG